MVAGHWIDDEWGLYSATLSFKKFKLPTLEMLLAQKMDLIIDWDLDNSMECVKTDNASEMVKGMRYLRIELNGLAPREFMDPNSIHVRSMAHVINLAVKECMFEVHSNIEKIRYLLSAVPATVKRWDLF